MIKDVLKDWVGKRVSLMVWERPLIGVLVAVADDHAVIDHEQEETSLSEDGDSVVFKTEIVRAVVALAHLGAAALRPTPKP